MRVNTRVPMIVAAVTLSVTAQAAEYSVTPFALGRTDADTNKRLTTQDSDTTFGTSIDAGAVFNASNPETSVSITPKVRVARYTDDGTDVDQDTEDYFLDLSGNHRFNETLSGGVFANYSNTGVVASELEDLSITFGDSSIAATGFDAINENFSRQTFSAGPSLTYILSEKNSLQFGASYTDVTYDTNTTTLSDYVSYSLNGSWVHQRSEKDQLVFSVFAMKQDPDLNSRELASINANLAPSSLNNEVDQVGFTLGYVRSFSDTLRANFSIGARKSDGEFPDLVDFDIRLSPASTALNGGTTLIPRDDPRLQDPIFLRANPTFLNDSSTANHEYQQGFIDKTGVVLDFSLEKQYENTTVTGKISRSSVPTGRGLTERDEVSVAAIHLFSDRLTGNGRIQFFSTQSESEEFLSGDNDKTDRLRLEGGLNWRWTEFWTVGAGYSYNRRSSDFSDSADGHGIYFTVGYNGNKYAISR